MALAIRVDQKSGILPRAAMSATPRAPRANAAAHRARARTLRFCSQDTNNKQAPTANADAEMTNNVEKLNVMVTGKLLCGCMELAISVYRGLTELPRKADTEFAEVPLLQAKAWGAPQVDLDDAAGARHVRTVRCRRTRIGGMEDLSFGHG